MSETTVKNHNLETLLHDAQWKEWYPALFARGLNRLKYVFKVKWDANKTEEFIHNSIYEAIDGIFISKTRNWNKDVYPSFIEFISSVLDSCISNTFTKRTAPVITNSEIIDNLKTGTIGEVEDKLSEEDVHGIIFEELKKMGASDEEMMIFHCLAKGMDKKQDIREDLGIEEKVFQNFWRKFSRKREIIEKILITHGYQKN